MKKHIRYTLIDRELAASFRAKKGTLFEMEFKKGMMEIAEEILGIEQRRVGGILREVGESQGLSGINQSLPIDLGEDVLEEVGVHFNLLLNHLLHLYFQGEPVCHTLYVRR